MRAPPPPTAAGKIHGAGAPTRRLAMLDNFSDTQVVRKVVVPTRGGIVAAQHRRAAEVGAAVLAAGGDAIDAAVATSFAIGVVEPWMSGPAAGGCMTIWRAREQKAWSVDYGMRAPLALDPRDYPLPGGKWRTSCSLAARVEGDRNVQGATAIAVPGVIAGMDLAHRRFGRMPWGRCRAGRAARRRRPACRLVRIAADRIGRAGAGARCGCGRDVPRRRPVADRRRVERATNRHIDQQAFATTLDIADAGADDFYRGDVARALVADVRGKGGCLAEQDLARYRRASSTRTRSRTAAARITRARHDRRSDPRPGARASRARPRPRRWQRPARRATSRMRSALDGLPAFSRPLVDEMGDAEPAGRADVHHAFQHRRPRRQHVRGHADAAVDLRRARGRADDGS